MKSQLIIEHTIYLILYLFILTATFIMMNMIYTKYVKVNNEISDLKSIYTKEKLLDTLNFSKYSKILLNYPLEAKLKNVYSYIEKNGTMVLLCTR